MQCRVTTAGDDIDNKVARMCGLHLLMRPPVQHRESVLREHPLSTYADFPAFLTPSPPLVRFSHNLSVLSAYFPAFQPPSPFVRTYLMDAP